MSVDTKLSNKFANMAFVCAIFVLIMHTGPIPARGTAFWYFFVCGREYVFRVAVPFFFLASGYFLAGHYVNRDESLREIWWTELKKRFFSLVIPFLIFNTFWWVLLDGYIVVYNLINGFPAFREIALTGEKLMRILGINLFDSPLLGPLWYVRELVMLVAVSPFLVILMRTKKSGVIALVLLLLLYGVFRPCAGLPGKWFRFFHVGISLEGVFYFSLGMFLRLFGIHVLVRRRIACACLALSCVLLLARFSTVVALQRYAIFLGIPLVMYFVWSIIPDCKWPNWVCGNAFPIYVLHPFSIWVIRWMERFIPAGVVERSLLCHVVEFSLAALLSLLVSICIAKKLPRFAHVAFGGR